MKTMQSKAVQDALIKAMEANNLVQMALGQSWALTIMASTPEEHTKALNATTTALLQVRTFSKVLAVLEQLQLAQVRLLKPED
jgi:hypothetical protein